MLYLLWSLLNIGLFIFFVFICFNATILLREKLGIFASIIFVFGLLSFIGNPNNDNKEPNSNQIKTWKFISEDSLKSTESYFLSIDLENSLVSKYTLGIKYGKDKQGQNNIPISSYSSTTGLISGINWKPVSIIVNRTNDNNKFDYSVYGVIEWKLLGAKLYSQPRNYKGSALIK